MIVRDFSRLLRLAGAVLALCALLPRGSAYSVTGYRWPSSAVTMHLQLGTSGTLIDGFASWGASAEDALSMWNSNIASTRFAVVRDSTAAMGQGNRTNNVFFSGDVYGTAWGTGVLAVTLTYTVGTSITETDVLFNNRVNWNSYRGAQRTSNTGAPVYDFHRVALHEFGHALGLEHPDENGQNVTALMNSRIGSVDTLMADDINGAQSVYGMPSGPAPISPPVITSHPTSRTVNAGQSTTFSVGVSSAIAVAYQWLKNGAAIAGATGSDFTIASATTTDAGNYAVVVSNSSGFVTSNPATLTVNSPQPPAPTPPPPVLPPPTTTLSVAPFITTHPASQSAPAGTSASFTVASGGTAPLTYQWRKDGAAISGATNASYTIARVQVEDAGSYSVTVSNSVGSATSQTAALTVQLPPTIATQPADVTAAVGTQAVFTVSATGTTPLSYQWRKDGAAIAGATGARLTLENVRTSDAGSYTVVVSNPAGTVTSTPARLTVASAPVISSAPVAQTVNAGERVTFTVTAGSLGTMTYQWLKDGAEIAGATNATLILERAGPVDGGSYSVRVTNAAGTVTSPAATLTVKFSRLANLSTRGLVPAGGTLTPGFHVRGSGEKPLLIRAVGPSLSLFGIGTALTEARLDLIAQDTATVLASSHGWDGNAALSNTFAQVGAFPLAAGSKDAAVQANLSPRGYTVRIAPGDPALSGITLAEIYDTDAPTAYSSRLSNVSTLGFVGTGETVLTAGFVITGNTGKRVLIRAVGPALAPFGVGNLLADPQLSLVPLGANTPIATNDDWADSPQMTAAFAAAGAFALPARSKDAALVLTLEPGAYTITVSGALGTMGNALVEIYDLDP